MIRSPENYGEIGKGNDTGAFNVCLDAIRRDTHGVLDMSSKTYKVGSLDATGIWSLEIQAQPNCVLEGSKLSIPSPILDLIGTRARIIGDLTVRGPSLGNPLGWVIPTAGILICNSDRTHIDGLKTDGQFSCSPVPIIAASSVNVIGGQWMNYHDTGPCVVISKQADWGINSVFSTIPLSPNVADVYFHGVEFHGLGGQQCTTWMRGADHVVFNGGIHDASNGKLTQMLFEGVCDRITVNGLKFYAEVGNVSTNIYRTMLGATCSHLRHFNASYDGVTDPNLFSGNFPAFTAT